jgi:hypothetical protein
MDIFREGLTKTWDKERQAQSQWAINPNKHLEGASMALSIDPCMREDLPYMSNGSGI